MVSRLKKAAAASKAVSFMALDDAELAARQKAREEEADMGPLEKFEKLYKTFEEEDEVVTVTLAEMFEMRRLSPSTEEDGKPWLLRWVTLSPSDCKLLVYADASEGDIHETIYLRGAQVVQVINGMPPGEGHMLRIVGASVWSKGLEMRRDRMEWHFATTDYDTCFAWAKMIQDNIDHANAGDVTEMLWMYTTGLGLTERPADPRASEVDGSEVWAFGSNDCGQLGVGCNRACRGELVRKVSGLGAAAAVGGLDFSLFVTRDLGELRAAGCNDAGQLGAGHVRRQNEPVLVAGDGGAGAGGGQAAGARLHGRVAGIVCGAAHTLVATNDDKVYSFGTNENGELGLGDGAARDASRGRVPTCVTELSGRRVGPMGAGTHSVLLCQDYDEVMAFGANTWGQLGLGHTTWHGTPQRVPALCRVRVHALACGYAHTYALTSEDVVYSFGRNDDGQLGLGHTDAHATPQRVEALCAAGVEAVSCGASHAVFRTSAGDVLATGNNSSGQLGQGAAGFTEEYRQEIAAWLAMRAKHLDTARVQLCSHQLRRGQFEAGASLADAISEMLFERDGHCPQRYAVSTEQLLQAMEDEWGEEGADTEMFGTLLGVCLLEYDVHAEDELGRAVLLALQKARKWLDKQDDGTGWIEEQKVWVLRMLETWRTREDRPTMCFVNSSTPVLVPLLCQVGAKRVLAGRHHTIALLRGTHEVYGCGSNMHGQLSADAATVIAEPKLLQLHTDKCNELAAVAAARNIPLEPQIGTGGACTFVFGEVSLTKS